MTTAPDRMSAAAREAHEMRQIDAANAVQVERMVLRAEIKGIVADRGVLDPSPEADDIITDALMASIDPVLDRLYGSVKHEVVNGLAYVQRLCKAAGPRAPDDDVETHIAKLAHAYAGLPELVYAARALLFEGVSDETVRRLDTASEYYAATFPWEDDPATEAPEAAPEADCAYCGVRAGDIHFGDCKRPMDRETALRRLRADFHKTRLTKDVMVNADALAAFLYPEER